MGLWLLLLAVVVLFLRADRQREIHETTVRGAATTALLQAHTEATFGAVDNLLADVAKTLESMNPRRHDGAMRQEMRKRIASMPYVRALFVIGPDGYILHDTDYPATPDVSLADRAYFQQYVQADARAMPISAPMLSRSGLGWFVAVTRRIGKEPDFRGVAVAAIQLSYFSDLYKTVGLGEGSEILLFHRDGRLIAQYPGTSGDIGESYAAFPLFREHLGRSASGAYLTDSEPLPYARVVTYAALPGIPLVVAHTQNMTVQLTRWTHRVIASAAVMLLLLGTLLYIASQYLRARRHRQLQLERSIHAEKMEALGQLTGGVAHDFGNILGVVATNIAVIRKVTATADGPLAAALDRAQRSLDSGIALTRQLMSFSRKRDLQLTACELDAEIASVLALLEHAAGPECKVQFEPGAPHQRCSMDRGQFEAALINLVVNARHAIGREGQITVRTRTASGGDLQISEARGSRKYICVSVVDNGKGMPEEVRRRATEPFFTTKGEHGTGFGIAQAYGMMQQLGGDLSIESEVGRGTSVHLCFPAIDAGLEPDASPR
jgi:signal transduction histidine kinase